MAWYYCLNNQRFGPVDEAAVKNLIAAGTVTRNTLVWQEGMDSWQPVLATPLAAILPPEPPPLVPPAYAAAGGHVMRTRISQQRLSLAGWLLVINAVLTVPIVILSVILAAASQASVSAASGFGARTVSALLIVAGTAVFVYAFSTLRVLLVERHSFHETSGLIDVLIAVNVVYAALDVLGVLLPAIETGLGILLAVTIFPLGIIYIIFAIKLLRLPDDLHGMLKPFSYTSIATGFCFGTILLIPLGLLTSAVSDILLAIIFFRAMEENDRAKGSGPLSPSFNP